MARIEHSASGGPSGREARWRHVAGLLSDWYGDWSAPTTKPGELDRAEARLGFALPAALRELHERFGQRTDAWNVQDVLYAPHELCVDQGHLVIASENQGVHRWAIPLAALHEPDPAVVLLADDERNLRQAAPSVSDLAVWWLLLGVKSSAARAPRWLSRLREGSGVLDGSLQLAAPALPAVTSQAKPSLVRVGSAGPLVVPKLCATTC